MLWTSEGQWSIRKSTDLFFPETTPGGDRCAYSIQIGDLRNGFVQGVNGHDFEAEESFNSDFIDDRPVGHCVRPCPKSTGTSGRTGACGDQQDRARCVSGGLWPGCVRKSFAGACEFSRIRDGYRPLRRGVKRRPRGYSSTRLSALFPGEGSTVPVSRRDCRSSGECAQHHTSRSVDPGGLGSVDALSLGRSGRLAI